MPTPNLFLTYVSDAETSTAFYSDLFDMQPSFISPRYVAFEISKDVLFAVWTGHNTHMEKQAPRTSEIGLMLDGPATRINETYRLWKSKGVQIVQPPYDDVFGRTFVVADPDGNLIRVSPVD